MDEENILSELENIAGEEEEKIEDPLLIVKNEVKELRANLLTAFKYIKALAAEVKLVKSNVKLITEESQ